MEKKEKILAGSLLLLLICLFLGISYAAFKFTGSGTKVNTITTGSISMSFAESDNIISIDKALPTTDNTGAKSIANGDYFEFSVITNITGNSYINYEISLDKIDEQSTLENEYVKVYLTRLNSDGTESIIMPDIVNDIHGISNVPTYQEELDANSITGRPAGEMSLYKTTASTSGELITKYRLRIFVAENYNPQGDGGDLTFNARVNVYGKNEASIGPLLKEYNSSDTELSQTDFHANKYKSNITSIVTKGDTIVPDTKIESWDLSTANDGSVVAYIEDDGLSSSTYKLTIGGAGKIIANQTMNSYFANFSKLTSIDLSYLDTSLVNDMSYMFSNCNMLSTLDLSKFNTSRVTDMSYMFNNCSSLNNLNIASFDTSKVINMASMFNNCSSLSNLPLTNFKTLNVKDMSYMFNECHNLTNLDVSSFDTSKVIDMDMMFYNCTNLTELNLASFETLEVTNMGSMFNKCSNITTLDLSSFNTNKVTDMYMMFANTPKLTSVLVSDNWVTTNADTRDMFTNSGVSDVTKN